MGELIELEYYRTSEGLAPYSRWLRRVDVQVARKIFAYVGRMRCGNFGDSRPIGQGISELRINAGPGYRVYYLRDGAKLVLLLCGGDKSTQSEDIRRARLYAADYRRRS